MRRKRRTPRASSAWSRAWRLLAYSTFGQPRGERSDQVSQAVAILDKRGADFEYDGDMSADVALDKDVLKLYPFCRLTDTANVLVMPAFHAASISTKLLKELGGATVMGPMLVGMEYPVQIATLGLQGCRRRQPCRARGV